MSSEIATVSIPESVNKAIASLQAAQTYFEKGEALRKAEIVFEQLDQFKKLHKDLTTKLEEAKAEIIIAIDRTRIEMREIYLKAVENGEMKRQFNEKPKEKSSEVRGTSEKQEEKSQSQVGISPQRLSEIKKIDLFDKKNPGTRENIIREMPNKGEKITKGISLKIAQSTEKKEQPRQNQSCASLLGNLPRGYENVKET